MRMRASHKVQILSSDDGVDKALFLEGAGLAEHEAGIRNLREELGIINDNIDGIERFTIKRTTSRWGKLPLFRTFEVKTSVWSNGRKKTIKVLALAGIDPQFEPGHKPTLMGDDPDFAGEFDQSNFVVYGHSERAKALLLLIEERAAAGDVAVYWSNSSSNPFSRGGLMVAIPSLIEQAYLDDIRATHLAEKALEAAAAKTGIAKRIEEKFREDNHGRYGKGYHALSPQWTSFFKGRIAGRGPEAFDAATTAHDVIFFLNPMDQHKNNFGWFTVEELEQWLEGRGPVPKSKTEAA